VNNFEHFQDRISWESDDIEERKEEYVSHIREYIHTLYRGAFGDYVFGDVTTVLGGRWPGVIQLMELPNGTMDIIRSLGEGIYLGKSLCYVTNSQMVEDVEISDEYNTSV
jgi:hypothetical protein